MPEIVAIMTLRGHGNQKAEITPACSAHYVAGRGLVIPLSKTTCHFVAKKPESGNHPCLHTHCHFVGKGESLHSPLQVGKFTKSWVFSVNYCQSQWQCYQWAYGFLQLPVCIHSLHLAYIYQLKVEVQFTNMYKIQLYSCTTNEFNF